VSAPDELAGSDPGDSGHGDPIGDDERWLRAREAGAPLPPLDPERAASYERLTQLLRDRIPDRAPATARDELRAALDAAAAPARRRRPLRWLAPALAAAAIAIVVFARRGPPPEPSEAFVVEVRHRDGTRAGSAEDVVLGSVGDELVVSARHSDLRELRVYRGDRDLLVRCPGHDRCAGDATSWRLVLQIDEPGSYRVIRIAGATAPPAGTFDDDIAALRAAGAALEIGTLVELK
jgi:hypothetical protein